eukprot:scaffold5481_cov117-Isochrysis_galbana.AAC.4
MLRRAGRRRLSRIPGCNRRGCGCRGRRRRLCRPARRRVAGVARASLRGYEAGRSRRREAGPSARHAWTVWPPAIGRSLRWPRTATLALRSLQHRRLSGGGLLPTERGAPRCLGWRQGGNLRLRWLQLRTAGGAEQAPPTSRSRAMRGRRGSR